MFLPVSRKSVMVAVCVSAMLGIRNKGNQKINGNRLHKNIILFPKDDNFIF